MIEHAEAYRAPWLGSIAIFLRGRTDKGEPANVGPIPDELLEPVPTGTFVESKPALNLTDVAARELLDSLLAAGVKPTETPIDAKGVVAAKDDHIHDLRKIIFESKP
jgi:hypothetical protein